MISRWFTPLLLYAVLANLPLWFSFYSFGLLSKGVFDVEFLLVGTASLFISRRAAAALLAAAIAVDLLSGISVTFLFTAPEVLKSLRWGVQLVPRHNRDFALLSLLILLPVLLAAALPRPPDEIRRHIAGILGSMFLICTGLDIATGHASSFWHSDRQLGIVRLSRTPLHSLMVMDAQQTRMGSAARTLHFDTVRAAFSNHASLLSLASASRSSVHPNLVLVLAESWGQPNDADLDRALVQPYEDESLRERYIVRRGTVPFHGVTLDGEGRELCSVAEGFSLIDASSRELGGCLPAQMKLLGYKTIGFHGFSGRMYDRQTWWKKIGFEQQWFAEQLEAENLPTCPGPFPGICDAALARWIGSKLEQPSDQPSFLYWVTLNSHLPVPVPNRVEHPVPCSRSSLTSRDSALCSWFQLVLDVHRSVAFFALRPLNRPTIILIVGDHQPPFSTAALREEFSSTLVPYVLLVPRGGNVPEHELPEPTLLAHRRMPSSALKARTKISRNAHAHG